MIGRLTLSLLGHYISLQLLATLNLEIRISKFGLFSLVYTRSNFMQLDEDFYSKLNNIAKVSVNLKIFVCFHGVCSLLSQSHDLFPERV